MAGISKKVIAVTIFAIGTSMPELATSIVAARKGRNQLALGNILGSNIFNIIFILGGSALITPLPLSGMGFIDLGVVLLSALLIMFSAYTFRKKEIDRAEGCIFLLIEALYMYYTVSLI
jgi:cation:H+ antiporter